LATFALTLGVDFFSTLSQTQFDNLMEIYGSSWWDVGSGSQVVYVPGQSYTLIDFLPPPMQALSGLHFKQQNEVFSLPYFVKGKESRLKDQNCLFLINCWGFAYNMLYFSRLPATEKNLIGLFFSVSSPTIAYDVFWDSNYFDHVQSSSENPTIFADETIRNAKLKPGDVILIWHQNQGVEAYLDHVAIFIDDDLYYEKSGTGDDVPFRLNDYAGLTSAWPINIGVFFVDWRRMKHSVTLPDPATRFGLSNPDTIAEIKQSDWIHELKYEVADSFSISLSFDAKHDIDAQTYTWIKDLNEPLVTDTNGRSILPNNYYDPEFYRISLPADIYK
jgi:hypothetical protein